MASDTAFTVKVNGRPFVLDRITLGDWRLLKTEFGLTASDIVSSIPGPDGEAVEVLNVDDPNVLVALLVLALRHEKPKTPTAELVAEVEALEMEGLEFPTGDDDDTESADPTEAEAAGNAATASPAKGGKSAKPRKQRGTQR